MAALEGEIREAMTFASALPPGATKDAAQTRVLLLQITRDMLQQRALATQYNVTLTYSLTATPAMPREPATAIVQEMAGIRERMKALESEASDPLKQIEIASLGATLAGLQQRVLFDRFGIPMLSVITTPAAPAPAAAPTSTAAERIQDAQDRQRAYLDALKIDRAARGDDTPAGAALDILDVDAKPTEANRVFVRFGWKVSVKNTVARGIAFDMAIEFSDASGFVVHTEREYGLAVNGYDDHEFTGDALISAGPAQQVSNIKAKIVRAQ